MNEEQIFSRAIEIENDRSRSDFLSDVCGDNDELRAQVEALLVAHRTPECILDSPADQSINVGPADQSMRRIGDFEIIREIGRGGMGVVYEARQLSLNRHVAVKVLSRGLGLSEVVILRFRREAEAAAKLHHTNIVPVYHTGEQDGSYYYAMELIRGPSLDEVIELMRVGPSLPPSATPYDDVGEQSSAKPSWATDTVALDGFNRSTFDGNDSAVSHGDSSSHSVEVGQFDRIAEMIAQVADALHHAHQNGVIHRDIKPANLLLAPDGRLSITDFGLARMLEQPGMTLTGEFMGTPRYMSPEQIMAGRIPIDHRTDIYSLGATLYELITLEPPFGSRQREQVLSEILHTEPKLPRRADRSIPKDLEAICLKAMTKNPDERYQSAKEVAEDLTRYIGRDVIHAKRITLLALATRFIRRHRVAVSTGGVLATLIILVSFLAWRVGYLEVSVDDATDKAQSEKSLRVQQDVARRKLPEVEAMIEEGDHATAFERLEPLAELLPGDPMILELMSRCSTKCSIRTEPEGATVYRTPYDSRSDDWEMIGTTPINDIRLANGFYAWKAEKSGFRTVMTCKLTSSLRLRLEAEGDTPAEMVRVTPPKYPANGIGIHFFKIPEFLIDRCEVTNEEYEEFVNERGYSRKELWKHPFVLDGNELPWEEAVKQFHDQSGRPGPATWKDGSFPIGEEKFPVRGISWYEAAAFAEFRGKRLPTIYDWYCASGTLTTRNIAGMSNLDGSAPVAVSFIRSIGPFGTYDMAGNVREWCWNQNETGRCYALGGAWTDPSYMSSQPEARPRWDRDLTLGFRCVRYFPNTPPKAAALQPVARKRRDYRLESPESDDAFRVIATQYDYDRSADLTQIDIDRRFTRGWVHETVKLDTPYKGETLVVHLFLPINASPPYQTVLLFPPGWAGQIRSIKTPFPKFVVEDGRALVWPEYEGTISRKNPGSSKRELAIHQMVDLSRTVDYMTQRTDINCDKLAFLGNSWGACSGAKAFALERRLKIGILVGGGLPAKEQPPELDLFNFLPRINCPTLMLNGRYDDVFPLVVAQQPMFERLGTPPKHKVHEILENHGHALGEAVQKKIVTNWLDRYFGKPERKD